MRNNSTSEEKVLHLTPEQVTRPSMLFVADLGARQLFAYVVGVSLMIVPLVFLSFASF